MDEHFGPEFEPEQMEYTGDRKIIPFAPIEGISLERNFGRISWSNRQFYQKSVFLFDSTIIEETRSFSEYSQK